MSRKVKELEATVADLERKLEQITAHIPRILDFDVLVELMQKDTPWKVAFTGSKRTGCRLKTNLLVLDVLDICRGSYCGRIANVAVKNLTGMI